VQFVACGGIDELSAARGTYARCAVYTVSSNSWSTTVANMANGVNHAAYCALSDGLVVFGGRGGLNFVGDAFLSAQKFSFSTQQWSTLPNLPTPRGGAGKRVVANEKAYIFGGEWSRVDYAQYGYGFDVRATDSLRSLRSSLRFSGNRYDYLAPMFGARHGTSAVVVKGEIWIIGGGSKSTNSVSAMTVRASIADLERCAT
jgi:N-acetylneuraminic acid mutarotase